MPIAFLLSNWKIIGIVAVLALIPTAYIKGQWDGDAMAVARLEIAARKEAAKRVIDMERNDAEFRSLPERERCLALARSSGLSTDACRD